MPNICYQSASASYEQSNSISSNGKMSNGFSVQKKKEKKENEKELNIITVKSHVRKAILD